jgi:hypothetical protein
MPSRTGTPYSRFAAFLDQALVGIVQFDLIDIVAHDVDGIAGVGDLDLLQHLADNHFDVLVVDEHALQDGRLPGSR